YKSAIESNNKNKNNNLHDIPFCRTYKKLLQQHHTKNIISLIFHFDGIGLCKSTKIKMWLFSTSIIELSPNLRYRRHNMPLVSVWVGYGEGISSDNSLTNNETSSSSLEDGPFDLFKDKNSTELACIKQYHDIYCNCNSINQCIQTYRRCIVNGQTHHSLAYTRRQISTSYFIQYKNLNNGHHMFGKIVLFFKLGLQTRAGFEQFTIKHEFS
ncbi:unnamed protein product, partial [Didymodactylos carnosus]